ncbi:CGNR zinc finger domain-containing protein [Dietzia sp. SLG310A2-38A2]|uniref:CGNR zinc finger domain-containing protein n=1 Tax=Dietzia sp. SLG310A2-38A2 TaxID=1630643 RepID=UPI00165764A2|nr:CGNR zinc finger domain-containing protein [Dietzia sp. SLG310A2-38A2]
MQSDLFEMPWIDENSVLAIANTVVIDDPRQPGSGHIDLLAAGETLAVWRQKVHDPQLAGMPLAELVELRGDVRSALDAADRAVPMPEETRLRLNALAAGAPLTFAVDRAGHLQAVELTGDAAGRVARETLRTVGDPNARTRLVRRCPAPGCGMFFMPGRRDQSWCTVRCGTRARATRLRQRTLQHPDAG